MEPEILVSISMRLPQADRAVLAERLSGLTEEAFKVGGITTNVSVQPYDPDEDPD